MYLGHFGLNEPPFRITPDTEVFFAGANRGATLEALLYAINHGEGIVKVSGEVGSGKTMLCRVLMERLPDNVETIYLSNPSLARDEILLALADELKLDLGSERSTRVLRSLQEELVRLYALGRRVVVLIDEAHAMPRETLEEIRLLSNLEANRHKLLQIVLFGQPELDEHLSTAGMRQLKERITHSFRLAPMARLDIESYIDFRLRAAGYRGPNPFSAAALRLIVRASEGLTRRINILADKSLLAAFASNSHAVTEREVRRAIRDSEFYRPGLARSRPAVVVGAIAGSAAGFALAWLIIPHLVESGAPRAGELVQPAPASRTTPALSSAIAAEPRAAREATPQESMRETKPPAQPASEARQARGPTSPVGSRQETRPAAPLKGKLVLERFAATQEWLQKAPAKNYAVQLMTVRDSDVGRLESFLAKASALVPEDELHVYSVKIDGEQHYRAAYGSYASSAEALAAVSDLPALLRAQHPYQRSVERMRSQNRQ